MKASEIRRAFLEFFREHGHEVVPSSSLVPGNDPTLLFTNAGMVQFKGIFVGEEAPSSPRAATAQKCVRAGGKHNDLEQVGETARHHTFFEMLGNFSFGDYFKREAIGFAWEFLTARLGIDPDRLYLTVHESDDEAERLWTEVAGVSPDRIFRLGDKDNFWQMADTGPCGPCSEIHFDLRPESIRRAGPVDRLTFIEGGEEGLFLELWNLVFMQYDRDAEGVLHSLPAPSIDTGAGLERLAAVLQGADSNYHTDLFRPLLEEVAARVGSPYRAEEPRSVSYRVLADHARAVAFLLSDGVFPSNEGRGYVLRRILRRAVRHAWLLGQREPTLVHVVDRVLSTMAGAWPELEGRREAILRNTRLEEERFLATIEGGLGRFDELAGEATDGVLSGEDAFRLQDTFGFPLDLTQLMARERGLTVDEAGFEAALEAQRARSRADRRASGVGESARDRSLGEWTEFVDAPGSRFVGYDRTEVATEVVAVRIGEGGRSELLLLETPFYAEGGGQVSDSGVVEGEGWRLRVEQVRRAGGEFVVGGGLEGRFPDRGPVPVEARVERSVRRDAERNHTATHLLHAALREVLGEHVVQKGSLVSPDRLRFDFAHPAPMTPEEVDAVERIVNQRIWEDHGVVASVLPYRDAIARGAMALFGEKYGDTVRMVDIPGVSTELCGGTHLRHTGEAGLCRIISEGGVASGVRRIEALTGPAAYAWLRARESELDRVAVLLRTPRDNVLRRAEQLQRERSELEELLDALRREGGGGSGAAESIEIPLPDGGAVHFRSRGIRARDAEDARRAGDALLEGGGSVAGLVVAEYPDGKQGLFAFVSDALIQRGVRADLLVREAASRVGGRGGGRPHLAQAGIEEPSRIPEAIRAGLEHVRGIVGGGA